jgi:hypothetical protein
MDNDIPVFDTIKGENVITRVLNELSDKSTKRDKDMHKMKAVFIPYMIQYAAWKLLILVY